MFDRNSFPVYFLKNKNWEAYGYFSVEDSVIFDTNNRPFARYDSGWLVSYSDYSIFQVTSDGRIVDINNCTIGMIEHYSDLPSDLDEANYMEMDQVLGRIIYPIFENSTDELIISYFNNVADICQADSIAKSAYFNHSDCPEYIILYATHLFITADSEAGKYGRISNTDERILKLLYDVYNFCNGNLDIARYGDEIKKIKELSNYLIGEYYATHNFMDEAEKVLNYVDVDMYPYKAVLLSMVNSYNMNCEYYETGNFSLRWGEAIKSEVKLLKSSLVSGHWFNPLQKSIALLSLQGRLCGLFGDIKDVYYSYQCLQFARGLEGADITLIDTEIKKYRKTILGKLVFKPL